MRRTYHQTFLVSVAILAAFSIPGTVCAEELDFYVYNGFDPVKNALTKIALIFGDHAFLTLSGIIIPGGIFLGISNAVIGGASGRRSSMIGWLVPVLFGSALYLGLVLNTGTIHLYDPVRNEYEPIGGIPDGIVMLAGLTNAVERTVVEVVDTAVADPGGYRNDAGGISFELIFNATSKELNAEDTYLDQSVERYIHDCLPIALASESYNVTLNDFKRGTTDPMEPLSELTSLSTFTVYSTDDDKGGSTMSCTEAWSNLDTLLRAPATFDPMMKQVCGSSGFNVNSPEQLIRCKEIVAYANQHAGLSGPDDVHFIRSIYLNRRMAKAFVDENPDLATRMRINRSRMIAGIGQALAANQWLSVMRAVLIAVTLSTLPIVLMLLPTPMMGKALFVAGGLMTWVMMWGIADAITHGLANDIAYDAMDRIRDLKLSYDSVILMPEATLKAMSAFGDARKMGVMLSTMLVFTLFGFGGFALAQMASGQTAAIQKQGERSAEETANTENRANVIQRMVNAAPEAFGNGLHRDAAQQGGLARGLSETQGAGRAVAAAGGASNLASDQAGRVAATLSQQAGYGAGATADLGERLGASRLGSDQGQIAAERSALREQGIDQPGRDDHSRLRVAYGQFQHAMDLGKTESASKILAKEFGGVEAGVRAVSAIAAADDTHGKLATGDLANRIADHEQLAGNTGFSQSDGIRRLAELDIAQKGGTFQAFQSPEALEAFHGKSLSLRRGDVEEMAGTLASEGISMRDAGEVEGFFKAQQNLGLTDAKGNLAGDAPQLLRRAAEMGVLKNAENAAALDKLTADVPRFESSRETLSFLAESGLASQTARPMQLLQAMQTLSPEATGNLLQAFSRAESANINLPISAEDGQNLREQGVINDSQNAIIQNHDGGQIALTLDDSGNVSRLAIEAGSRVTANQTATEDLSVSNKSGVENIGAAGASLKSEAGLARGFKQMMEQSVTADGDFNSSQAKAIVLQQVGSFMRSMDTQVTDNQVDESTAVTRDEVNKGFSARVNTPGILPVGVDVNARFQHSTSDLESRGEATRTQSSGMMLEVDHLVQRLDELHDHAAPDLREGTLFNAYREGIENITGQIDRASGQAAIGQSAKKADGP